MRKHVTSGLAGDLMNFRSNAVNFKIALWDPKSNGVRYLKQLLHALCVSTPAPVWKLIQNIKRRGIGNPYTVRFNGVEICLDYLQAGHEVEFIENHAGGPCKRVLEIGAGYGRTCHAVLSNWPVQSYCIVDLTTCLDLSSRYLRKVLPARLYSKIRFIDIADIGSIQNDHFDLCINIDSFAEMDPPTVKYYLRYIDRNCARLYTKNPVGKYLDRSLDNHSQGAAVVRLALSTGLLRDIVDIHDNRAVSRASKKFVAAYRPGSAWRVARNGLAVPWSYYWQAMYRRASHSRQ